MWYKLIVSIAAGAAALALVFSGAGLYFRLGEAKDHRAQQMTFNKILVAQSAKNTAAIRTILCFFLNSNPNQPPSQKARVFFRDALHTINQPPCDGG